MAALSDWQRPALSSSYKYIMFVWNLKPRVKEVTLVPWFVALLQNGEWKLCGKGVVFTLRNKAAGEAGYIEEKQVAKILGRSLQRLNLSAGHRSTQQQFNKLYFCFLYLCISSLKTFLRGRVQFNHSIVFLFLLLVILGVTDQIPLLESHCPSIFLAQIWFEQAVFLLLWPEQRKANTEYINRPKSSISCILGAAACD